MNSTCRHYDEVRQNRRRWAEKPLLQKIYRQFYSDIAACIDRNRAGTIVELGSGIGNLKMAVPGCLATDIYPYPWIDRVENAYHLSFNDGTVSHLILFDVWHHLQYPGTALQEFFRVLAHRGRIILFEPDMSLLGLLAYGLLHKEPLGLYKRIQWQAPDDGNLSWTSYYAAQANAYRIFLKQEGAVPQGFRIIALKRISAIAYLLSGGYGMPQLYPEKLLPALRLLDTFLGRFPKLFSTRLLIVLEKDRTGTGDTAATPCPACM